MILTSAQVSELIELAGDLHARDRLDERDGALRLARSQRLTNGEAWYVSTCLSRRKLSRRRDAKRYARKLAGLSQWVSAAQAIRVEPLEHAAHLAFFAGVELEPHPLVEVCTRLAWLYEALAEGLLTSNNAQPGCGWALVRRAKLQCGLPVEYSEADAQRVKRVLERLAVWPRDGWSELDERVFALVRGLRGNARMA